LEMKNFFLYFGIFGMILLLVGVFSEPASLLQKLLFLTGAVILTIVAFKSKQKMLSILQVIIVIGSSLAFFEVDESLKYFILLGASILGVAYLISIKYYRKDPWGLACTVGLLMLAAGFATDAVEYPLQFGIFLGGGPLLVALYSFVDYFYHKVRISLIWFILNIIFAINPLLIVISNL